MKTNLISSLKRSAVVTALLLSTAFSLPAQNLLKNGDFSAANGNVPTQWRLLKNMQTVSIDTSETTGDAKQSLRVDIGKTAGGLGQIIQQVSVSPYKKYRLKFDMKSSAKGVGLGSVKSQIGKTEINRQVSSKSDTEWKSYTLDVDSVEANLLLVLLRYEQKPNSVGQKVWFANVSLELVGDAAPPATAPAAAPAENTPATEAEPTTESETETTSETPAAEAAPQPTAAPTPAPTTPAS
jgi:hypothetical protein